MNKHCIFFCYYNSKNNNNKFSSFLAQLLSHQLAEMLFLAFPSGLLRHFDEKVVIFCLKFVIMKIFVCTILSSGSLLYLFHPPLHLDLQPRMNRLIVFLTIFILVDRTKKIVYFTVKKHVKTTKIHSLF